MKTAPLSRWKRPRNWWSSPSPNGGLESYSIAPKIFLWTGAVWNARRITAIVTRGAAQAE